MKRDIPNVGASDPELRTSPILDDDEEESLDAELETGVCYFNGVSYPIGEYVRSGEEVLPAPAAVYASAREKFEP